MQERQARERPPLSEGGRATPRGIGEGVQGMPGSSGGLQSLVQELEGSERALASTLPHVAPLSFAAHLSAQLAGSARDRQDEVLREFPRACCLAALQDGCEEARQRFARLLRLRLLHRCTDLLESAVGAFCADRGGAAGAGGAGVGRVTSGGLAALLTACLCAAREGREEGVAAEAEGCGRAVVGALTRHLVATREGGSGNERVYDVLARAAVDAHEAPVGREGAGRGGEGRLEGAVVVLAAPLLKFVALRLLRCLTAATAVEAGGESGGVGGGGAEEKEGAEEREMKAYLRAVQDAASGRRGKGCRLTLASQDAVLIQEWVRVLHRVFLHYPRLGDADGGHHAVKGHEGTGGKGGSGTASRRAQAHADARVRAQTHLRVWLPEELAIEEERQAEKRKNNGIGSRGNLKQRPCM